MPTNKIGLYSFITLGGQLDPAGEVMSDITPRGVDGNTLRREGVKGRMVELRPIADVSSQAMAEAAIGSVNDLRGTVVTIYDAHGITYTNCAVLDAQLLSVEHVPVAVGGLTGGGWVISWRVVVQMGDTL